MQTGQRCFHWEPARERAGVSGLAERSSRGWNLACKSGRAHCCTNSPKSRAFTEMKFISSSCHIPRRVDVHVGIQKRKLLPVCGFTIPWDLRVPCLLSYCIHPADEAKKKKEHREKKRIEHGKCYGHLHIQARAATRPHKHAKEAEKSVCPRRGREWFHVDWPVCHTWPRARETLHPLFFSEPLEMS